MNTRLRAACAAAVLSLLTAQLSPATEPDISRSGAGDAVGKVVKVDPGSITISTPVTVQTGVRYHTVGSGAQRHRVATPTYGTKHVETTVPVSPDVRIRTAAGKAATLADVRAGVTVQLHAERVVERPPGSKPTTRYEVTRIVVPVSGK